MLGTLEIFPSPLSSTDTPAMCTRTFWRKNNAAAPRRPFRKNRAHSAFTLDAEAIKVRVACPKGSIKGADHLSTSHRLIPRPRVPVTNTWLLGMVSNLPLPFKKPFCQASTYIRGQYHLRLDPSLDRRTDGCLVKQKGAAIEQPTDRPRRLRVREFAGGAAAA